MKRRRKKTAAVVASFSAGAFVGACLALLYAPKAGHDTRVAVSGATGNTIWKMKNLIVEAHEKLNRNLRKGRDYAEERASAISGCN